ncbi:phage protein D [Kribbella kalugense]|uniref:Phage protein D n=1 Tax=Kribbella kalugense TaxID=2512221 RepID=A0A4R7ZVV3_9ACTN|nr:phage protein D [Kribbella kalugense]
MTAVLESVLGIRLLLWAGDPLPVPRPQLLPALRTAEVTNDSDSMDGFQLTFALTKNRLGRFDIIDTLAPGTRVWIGAVLGVVPQPLIDGVVERHDLMPSGTPGESTLTVTGTTITSLLGLAERNQPHPNQPDSVIVMAVLAQYPELGLVPAVAPTTDIPLELDRTPQQNETDLALIERLATANSFVFYTEPITFGVNKAYWGPVLRTSLPQPRLTVGMGPHQNVRSLSFGFDSLAAVGAEGSFIDPIFKLKIPLPAMPALRIPPLSASPAAARRTTRLRTAANAGPALGALASAAAATQAPEAVSGSGTLDTSRYGAILRARGLVGLRGAGTDYDGYYYVRRVTHTISVGSYTQSFALSREGTSSLTPVVVP